MRYRAAERNVGGLRQRGNRAWLRRRPIELVAGHGNQRHAQPLYRGQQLQDLGSLTTGGQSHHDVTAHHHTQVAVHGFGGMQKQGRASGRGKRGRNFACDQPALAHAGYHHPPGTAVEQLDGPIETLCHRPSQTVSQGAQGCGFDANHIFASIFHEGGCCI